MAQIVVVEPGDVLVIGHVGDFPALDVDSVGKLKEALGVALVVLVPGPVDLGVVRQHLAQAEGGGS